MKNLLLTATNLIGFLFVIVGVWAFFNLFTNTKIGYRGIGEVPSSADSGIMFLMVGIMFVCLSQIFSKVLKNK